MATEHTSYIRLLFCLLTHEGYEGHIVSDIHMLLLLLLVNGMNMNMNMLCVCVFVCVPLKGPSRQKGHFLASFSSPSKALKGSQKALKRLCTLLVPLSVPFKALWCCFGFRMAKRQDTS